MARATPEELMRIVNWGRKNPEKVAEYKRRYREKNRDAIVAKHRVKNAEIREAALRKKAEWEASNQDQIDRDLASWRLHQARKKLEWSIRKYKVTIEEYVDIMIAQGGRCAICGSTKANGRGNRLHLDHCHRTGKVRGLLCSKCNSTLGYMNDDPKRLRRAAAYLEKRRGETAPNDRGFIQPVLGDLSSARGAP